MHSYPKILISWSIPRAHYYAEQISNIVVIETVFDFVRFARKYIPAASVAEKILLELFYFALQWYLYIKILTILSSNH